MLMIIQKYQKLQVFAS